MNLVLSMTLWTAQASTRNRLGSVTDSDYVAIDAGGGAWWTQMTRTANGLHVARQQ